LDVYKVDRGLDMMEGLHTYLYTAKIAVSRSIISKKSSAAMIVVAVILFQKLLTSLLMYYTMASAAFVLY
jgi:hypothetical protein